MFQENSSVQRPKVLLCTPSNAAIDELTRRLIQKRERKESKLRISSNMCTGLNMQMSVSCFLLLRVLFKGTRQHGFIIYYGISFSLRIFTFEKFI